MKKAPKQSVSFQHIDGSATAINTDNFVTKKYPFLFEGKNKQKKLEVAEQWASQRGKQVYMIDLSPVVSKYISETEKNIKAILEKAEAANWVLFFDEADALFGNRTTIRDAHDRFANRKILYIIEMLSSYPHEMIFSTNSRRKIDPTLLRKFYQVQFPKK